MRKFIALVVGTSLAVTPISAAAQHAALVSAADRPAPQTSMFAGATFRISLDGRGGPRWGRPSLKVSAMASTPGSPEVKLSEGLEIAPGRTGKATLHISGHDVGDLKKKSHLDGTTTALVVGGVVVLVVAAALVYADYERDRED